MHRSVIGAIGMAVVLGACGDGGGDPPVEPPNPFDTTEAFPSSGLEVLVRFPEGPAHAPTQTANNNLDVATFGGRTFLAWRTAPTHFASADAEIVVTSEGPDGWREEGRFARGTDLREPRFLALGDRLFLYFAVLGTDPLAFEPQGTLVTEWHAPAGPASAASWDEPEWIDLPDFIPWRARAVGNEGYLVGYDGGENIYQFDGQPIHVRFLRTTDGRTLDPVWPDNPVAIEGGSSETDFVILDDGAMVTVSRNEAGDEAHGFGSLICRSEAADAGVFHCAADRRKYDSPLMFRGDDGAVWLVARRDVTPSGEFDLGYDFLPLEERAAAYNAAYSATPKRCALWRVDQDALVVSWVQDLPSRGDTCFPAMTKSAAGTVTLFNYTSPLAGAIDCPAWPDECTDEPWAVGQVLPTEIYRIDLALP